MLQRPSPFPGSDVRRLVLFDIDGTLVQGGPAKEAFHQAMVETFGMAGDIEVHDFSGKTDPQIARELLTGAGLDDREVDDGLPSLWAAYLRELEARLAATPVEILDGVAETLDALESEGDVALGLVTGNIADGARLKLTSAGLFERFRVGGYGSDHEVRNHLPSIAIARARETWGCEFDRRDVVIVGDTPRDVACARHEGVVAVAVATGRHAVADLEREGPDRVFRDLSDTSAVLDALVGGG